MRKLTLLLLLAFTAAAQTSEVSYEPKNLAGDRANRAINFIRDIMGGRGQILWEPVLRQVVIKGSKDDVAQVLQLLQKYDVPEARKPEAAKQIEYTIHLVGASDTGNRGAAIPPHLEAAIQQMKAAFPYKEYRLLETLPFTARGRSTEYSGILSTSAVGTNVNYFYKCSITFPTVLDEGKTVGSEFSFFVTIPGASEKAGEVGIRTELQVKEGQKVVLGKLKLDGGPDAIFLVVTVRLS